MKVGLGLTALLLGVASIPARAQTVNAAIYSGHTNVGGGTPYTGFVGNVTSSAIDFGTSTGFNWHPFGLGDFGADITTTLNNPTTQDVQFTVTSDDGTLLFLDGAQIVDNGGPHSPFTSTSATLTLAPGSHPLEAQFFECCSGPSGIDVTFTSKTPVTTGGGGVVPEPGSLALFLPALVPMGLALRRRRKID